MPKKKPITAKVNAVAKQLRKLSKRMTRAIICGIRIQRHAFWKKEALTIARMMKRAGATRIKVEGARGLWIVKGMATTQQLAAFASEEARIEQEKCREVHS